MIGESEGMQMNEQNAVMEEEIILKKKGVALVKKRLKELLTPLGFQSYPRSTTRLVRVRDAFIDVLRLDTAGYHLDIDYYIYLRYAPFAGLYCDAGRLWRAARDHIGTHLFWSCEIPPSGGPYYYKPKYFEAVWRDVALVLKQYILPQMEAMTEEKFLSHLQKWNQNDRDLFRAYQTVSLTIPYHPGTGEAAAYGVGMWRQGKYKEGAPYLALAQRKYYEWLMRFKQEANHPVRCHAASLALLDELLIFWENKETGWEAAIQERIEQVSVNWLDYML